MARQGDGLARWRWLDRAIGRGFSRLIGSGQDGGQDGYASRDQPIAHMRAEIRARFMKV
jgi:hypothetical protein